MSSPTVITELTNVDPNQPNPTNLQGLIDILNPLLVSSIEGTFVPYVISSSTPATSDQDKVWMKTDGAGRPLGIYLFYNGAWRRFYGGNPKEIRMFSGDPALYFDGTGLGLQVPTNGDLNTWDGWALCNGKNGTTNLSNQFIVGGQMDNVTITGYNNGWQTNVTGTALQTGGSATTTIVNNNLPNMTVSLTGKIGYDDNTSQSSNQALVTTKWYAAGTDRSIQLASFGANPTGSPAVPQVPVVTVPPFLALAFVQFVSYA